jgi:hypothetical protein
MNVLASLITLLIMATFCALLLFALLLMMNGFSERQASFVIVAYFAATAIFSLLSAGLAWLLYAKSLAIRLGKWSSIALSSLIATIAGAAIVSVLAVILIGVGSNLSR